MTATTKITKNTNLCWKCSGTGIYKWGAVVNGVCQFQGTCWRCNGSGIDPVATGDAKPASHGPALTPEQAAAEKARVEAVRAAKRAEAEAAEAAYQLRERIAHEVDVLNKLAAEVERACKTGDRDGVDLWIDFLNTLMTREDRTGIKAPNVYAHLIESATKVKEIRFGA